jgi:hypothetical protein
MLIKYKDIGGTWSKKIILKIGIIIPKEITSKIDVKKMPISSIQK